MTSGDIGCNALGCLTTSCFLRRSGGTFRNSNEPLHAIAQEPRIAAFRTRLHMAAFWSNASREEGEEGTSEGDESEECCIRTMLRGGLAALTEPQPSSLQTCLLGQEAKVINMVGEWIPCAEIAISTPGTTTQKKAFICGLCGTQKAKEVSSISIYIMHVFLEYICTNIRSHLSVIFHL
jgi:hypothetical protein